MNSVFKKLPFCFALLLLLIGCIKELTPNKNGYVAKPVFWAILNPDSSFKLISGGNRGMADENYVNLYPVTIHLYENGTLLAQLNNLKISSDSQTHFFKVKPGFMKNYTLKILHQGTEMMATVKVPSKMPPPNDVILSPGEHSQLIVTIVDDIALSDAYQFKVRMKRTGILVDTATLDTLQRNYFLIHYYDKFDEPNLSFDYLGLNPPLASDFTFPVNDNLFNGKSKSFIFSIQNPGKNEYLVLREKSSPPVSDKFLVKQQYIEIVCRKLAPEYYKFMASEVKSNAIFGTPYFNPANLYSNIEGGLGLFAAVSERRDTVWIIK